MLHLYDHSDTTLPLLFNPASKSVTTVHYALFDSPAFLADLPNPARYEDVNAITLLAVHWDFNYAPIQE